MPDDFADTFLEKPLGSVVPTIALGDVNGGSIEELGDTDIFAVNLEAGASYIFDLEGLDTDAGTLPDPVLTLFDSAGLQVAGDDDFGVGLNSQVLFTPISSGTYFIEASSFPVGIPDQEVGNYRLTAITTPAITSDGGGPTANLTRSENNTAVTTVIATLSLSPGDTPAGDLHTPATSVTYSIIGGSDADDFTIDPATGVLSFVSAPNFETPTDSDSDNSYSVEVQATDDGTPSLSDTQAITVNISDVAGVTVTGTNANDIVKPSQTVPGQPLPSVEDDIIFGLDGADELDGGVGADRLEGGDGADTYRIDNSGDVIVEEADGGTDTVITATLSYSLKNTNLENLNLDGFDNLSIKGNELSNLLEGNYGDNYIYGYTGDDQMQGGAGADTFAFVDNGGDDLVFDFEDGIDIIDLTRVAGVDSFDDIDLDRLSDGVQVDFGTGTIVLADVTKAELDGSDFIFA